METAIVNGVVYAVLSEKTPDDYVREGRTDIASRMRERGILAEVRLSRPKGVRTYLAYDFGPHPTYGDNRRYRIVASVR